jgi:glucan phosphoethanolaminetransferase (alkaline phosphatase superfamily)
MDVASLCVTFAIFALTIIFMTMGFSFNKAKAVALLNLAAVMWLVLSAVFPVVLELAYPYLGIAFLAPAIACFLFSLPPAIELWRFHRKEEWEREDEEE